MASIPDVSSWSNLQLGPPVSEGHRNDVWTATLNGQKVVVRRSRRSLASLEWELDLLQTLHHEGFRVAPPIHNDRGERHHEGVVVQPWLDGRPPTTEDDWRTVAATLRRLHSMAELGQRPGCCSIVELDAVGRSVDADIEALPTDVRPALVQILALGRGLSRGVIHGDPGPSNIRLADDGSVGLIDFDESRVDVTCLDLANLGVQILDDEQHQLALDLADAWEAVNGWISEPGYARRRWQTLQARRNPG